MVTKFVLPLVLLTSQIAFGMRFDPDDEIKKNMKVMHPACSGSDQPKPRVEKFKAPKRTFIAKMDSFGLDRYFIFDTNEQVDQLVQAVERGGGWQVEWFYYDGVVSLIKQVAPNIVVITDNQDDDQVVDQVSEDNQNDDQVSE